MARGELVGMQLLMEDVLLSTSHGTVERPPGQQATLDKNPQVFLVNSLHNWPMPYGPGGPP